jgi:Plavaka transposase
MAHCHRELYHAQWAVILDEFLEAYVHGIVIHCCDGIRRRFRVYPRIFTYSADYRERYVSSSNTCILRLKYTVEFS